MVGDGADAVAVAGAVAMVEAAPKHGVVGSADTVGTSVVVAVCILSLACWFCRSFGLWFVVSTNLENVIKTKARQKNQIPKIVFITFCGREIFGGD